MMAPAIRPVSPFPIPCPLPDDPDLTALCVRCGHPRLNHAAGGGDGNGACALCGVGLRVFSGVAV